MQKTRINMNLFHLMIAKAIAIPIVSVLHKLKIKMSFAMIAVKGDTIMRESHAMTNCPDCKRELGHPPQRGEKMFNDDQWEAMTSGMFCRWCDKCFDPECKCKDKA